MASPGRLPAGVTNATRNSALWQMPQLDPTKVHSFFDDFDHYAAGDWTITTVEGGAGDATEALADGDGGRLLITNDAGASDVDYFQKKGESFLLVAGKRAWFKARFTGSEATTAEFVMGLQVTDTTPLAVSDGIYFLKPAAAATFDFIVRQDATTGSNSDTAVATLVAGTMITLGWYYDGNQTVHYYVDDVLKGLISGAAAFLPNTELTVSFGVRNGEAVAKTMTVDYVFAAKER